jgi:hypothetical protein
MLIWKERNKTKKHERVNHQRAMIVLMWRIFVEFFSLSLVHLLRTPPAVSRHEPTTTRVSMTRVWCCAVCSHHVTNTATTWSTRRPIRSSSSSIIISFVHTTSSYRRSVEREKYRKYDYKRTQDVNGRKTFFLSFSGRSISPREVFSLLIFLAITSL